MSTQLAYTDTKVVVSQAKTTGSGKSIQAKEGRYIYLDIDTEVSNLNPFGGGLAGIYQYVIKTYFKRILFMTRSKYCF